MASGWDRVQGKPETQSGKTPRPKLMAKVANYRSINWLGLGLGLGLALYVKACGEFSMGKAKDSEGGCAQVVIYTAGLYKVVTSLWTLCYN